MTATERLRALLDERGVEWKPIAWNPKRETFYHTSDGIGFCADEYTDGVRIYTDATITPEQAVAATLGETPTPPPPKMPEQPPYDLLIDLLRDEWGIDVSWDGLRRFWYVGLNEKGVRMRDEREAATLGPGTCEVEESWHGESEMVEYHCTACDEYMAVEVVKPDGAQPPNYCPNCGRKVVE